MTSKNLCFRLMKEDMKRRVWTIALTVLGFVFTILIPTAIKCGEFRDCIVNTGFTVRSNYIQDGIIRLLRTGEAAVMALIIASLLWAVSGFHYLHNSKKVDFYHSLPIKRWQLFLAIYANGILIPAVIYLLILLPAVGIALQAGVGVDAIGMVPWQGYVLHLIYYSLLYTTTVVAMMLTGNMVVALLGVTVFYSYGPAVIALALAYCNSWFHTFTMTAQQERKFLLMLWYSSPFANYIGSVGDFNSGLWYVHRLIAAALVTILLAAVSYVLYRLRPSEAAGKAMAFRQAQMPIKVLLVIPISVAFGIFFYILRSHLTWLVFGTLCGIVLTHCLIEVIYHFDFRRLFAHKLHMAGCVGVSMLLMLAGYFDWYGYDTWVPEPGTVESAAISLYDKDEWVTYGQVDTMKSGNGRPYVYWNYKNRADYCYENMNMTDPSLAIELAQKGVDSEKAGEKDKSLGSYSRDMFMVQFRLKNGKTAQRRYRIPVDEEITKLVCAIHDDEEYRQGAYPIMKQTKEDTAEVFVQQFGRTKEIKMDSDTRGQLLEAYQEEWKSLTAETRGKDVPIGIIQFNTVDLAEARKEYEEHMDADASYYYDLSDQCCYPIYPSFARTLKILEDEGFTFISLDETNVSKIRIEHYPIYNEVVTSDDGEVETLYEGGIRDYEGKEDLKMLLPALCYSEYYHMGGGFYNMDLDYNASVIVYIADLDQRLPFYLDLSKLSFEEAETYGFYREKEE